MIDMLVGENLVVKYLVNIKLVNILDFMNIVPAYKPSMPALFCLFNAILH